jgi:hypothetical protein
MKMVTGRIFTIKNVESINFNLDFFHNKAAKNCENHER